MNTAADLALGVKDPSPSAAPAARARRRWLIIGAVLQVLMVSLTAFVLTHSVQDVDRMAADAGVNAQDAAGADSAPELSPERLQGLVASPDPVAHLSRQTLETAGLEQLAAGTIVPSGDTVLMRHLGLAPALPYAIVQRFQAVALSGDEEFRRRELSRLAEEPIPEVRYRALLEQVRTVLRGSAGRVSEAAADIDRALAITGIDKRLTVDALYFKAIQLDQEGMPGRAREAINRALDIDPFFLWAHWARVSIAAALLEENAKHHGDGILRRRLVGELIRSLNHVTALSRGSNAVRDLMTAARSLEQSSDPNARFASGYVHLVAGNTTLAREILIRIDDACRAMAGRCVSDVAAAAAALLDMTGGRK